MGRPERHHLPRPGVRFALECPKNDCGWREFDNPDWKCPTHNRAQRQRNNTYFGQSTA